MNVLIAFATTEGQTRKIATRVSDRLSELGHRTDVVDTSAFEQPSVSRYDKIFVMGSVHQERHQEALEVFVMASLAELQQRPSLFISVSLSAAFPEGAPDAVRYIDTFLKTTGWQPSRALPVAGALRNTEYDYFKAQIVRHVVLKGREPLPRSDYEFTDWDALLGTVEAFLSD
jgi:menaquinone-dependent protoporphyrinogen oxidase